MPEQYIVFTAEGHGLLDGQTVRISGMTGSDDLVSLNGQVYAISDKTTDTFKLKTLEGEYVTAEDGSYSGGGSVRRVAKVWTGFSHLAGRSVLVLADGVQLGPYTVSAGGAVTISEWASAVRVGLAYTSRLITMPPEVPMRNGSSRAMKKRVVSATLGIYASGSYRLGPRADKLDPVTVAAGELYTGLKTMTSFPGGLEKDGSVCIETNGALPLTVTHINTQLEI